MREFLAGKTQRAIGEQLNVTAPCICSALMKFYADFGYWSNEFSHILDYNKRRNQYFRQALDNYIFADHEITEPALIPVSRPTAPKPDRISNDYPVWYSIEPNLQANARQEHAWLLRAEGLTYRQVGERLGGISVERARQIVCTQGRRMSRALQRTRFKFEYPEDRELEYFQNW